MYFRHIVLVFDEMKIQESLVFDSKSGNIIGYVDVGDMNMQLKNFEANLEEKAQEKEVATHMLMLYVRGIFTKMEYPLAQFPTTGTYLDIMDCMYIINVRYIWERAI